MDNKNIGKNYKILITPKRNHAKNTLLELIQYRDLILLLVKKEFVSKYKQTILGPLWAVIQPVMTSLVFTIIFGSLAKLTISDTSQPLLVPSFLFYMSGTILWNYFSSVVTATSNTFIANSHIMSKVYFPRLAVPIATAISNLISLGIQMVLFIVVYIICYWNGETQVTVSPWMLLLIPLVILQLMLLSTSIGIIVSSLTTKYRDLTMLVSFGLQLWQYGTPIAYGLEMIPKKWLSIYLLNPITPCILAFRYAMFGTGYINIGYYIFSWIVTIVFVIISILVFNRIERTFIDTI